MTGTKEKISDKALELFNDKGIEYVGMRELAAELGMRIGNITYYFPTKDDLVFAIATAYSEANNQIHGEHEVNGLYDFLQKCRMLFLNGVKYRCLMLSMVHVMDQNQLVAESYRKVSTRRFTGLAEMMNKLKEEKHINVEDEDVEWFLMAINSLISRFWYSEAALTVKRNKLDTHVDRYLKLQAMLFKPYATKKGMKDLERFLVDNK